MADIAQLLSNAADTKADFNFGKINDAYWAGLENAYKQRTRDAFQDPALYGADGNIDPNKVVGQALRVGGIPAAKEVKDLFGVGLQQRLWGNNDQGNVNPPSISGTSVANEKVADDLTQGRGRSSSIGSSQPLPPPQASNPPPGGHSVMSYLVASGVPNNNLDAVATRVAEKLGIGKLDTIDTNNPAIRGPILEELSNLKNAGLGQSYAPGQAVPGPQTLPQVAQAGAPQQAPPQGGPTDVGAQARPPQPVAIRPLPLTDPTLGGRISAEELRLFGSPERVIAYNNARIARGLPDETRAPLAARMAAAETELAKQRAPTDDAKKAFELGMTPRAREDFHARTNEEKLAAATGKTTQEVMDKTEQAKQQQAMLDSALPIIKESRTAAETSFNSIRNTQHAMELLDTGNVITGKWADDKLNLLKIAAVVGADTSKIRDTETFNAQMKSKVLEKAALLRPASDTDVKFLSSSAGNSSLDAGSLRKILGISEQLDREKIAKHNAVVDSAISANENLKDWSKFHKVEPPAAYQRKLQEGMTIRNPKTGQVKQVKNGQLVDVK